MEHSPRLLGRDREREAIARHMTRARGGTPAVVLLEGEPGIGKSALLELAGRMAEEQGFVSVVARADELDQRPLGVASQALAGVGGPGNLDEAVDRVEELALKHPVLVSLDDLQWADDESLRWLAALSMRLAGLPVLIAAALRPTPRSHVLGVFVDRIASDGGAHLCLGPLASDDAEQLAARCAGRPLDAGLARVVAAAGGNPFLIIEAAAAVLDLARTGLTGDLRRSILQRFSRLVPASMHELQVAAALGSHLDVALLAEVLEIHETDLVRRLGPAIEAGLLCDDGRRLRFRHDLVRQAIYDSIPSTLRRSMHRVIARVMTDREAPAARIVIHAAASVEGADRDAFDRTRAAADRAESHEDRARLLELAVRAAPDADAEDRARADLANVLWRIGRSAEVEALVHPLLGRTDDVNTRVRARLGLGCALRAMGRHREAIDVFGVVLDDVDAPPAARTFAKTCVAVEHVWLGEAEPAMRLGGEAVAEAELLGASDPAMFETGVSALNAVLAVQLMEGRAADAVASGRRAMCMLERSGGSQREGMNTELASGLGPALSDADAGPEAVQVLTSGLRIAERDGFVERVVTLHGYMAIELYRSGRLDDAAVACEAAIGAAVETENPVGLYVAYALLARIALHRGDDALSAAAVSDAFRLLERHGPGPGLPWLFWVQAVRGERDPARAWRTVSKVGFAQLSPVAIPELLRVSVERGAHDVAAAIGRTCGNAIAQLQSSTAIAAATRCVAALAGDVEALDGVLLRYEGTDRVLEHAAALVDAARAHEARGSTIRAQALREQAARIYDSVGAPADAAVLDIGVDRRPTSAPAERPLTGWPALTPAEVAVVRLVREGLTNRQIGERLGVARSTVQTHLLHVFRKLQCTSRAQLAAMATEAGV